jgi:thiol-disulfide isomerase/thioredoxin
MAHPDRNFLLRRRLLLAAAPAIFAHPALADVGPGLARGSMAAFKAETPPRALPDFAFTDADDKPVSLADYRGRAVLLNFWATWCAPCVKEMPSLDRLQAALGRERFLVLPLSLDTASRAKVRPFYEDRKLANLGIYYDRPRKSMQVFEVGVLPTSILIDPQGRALGRIEGEADWDTPEALALLKAAVG